MVLVGSFCQDSIFMHPAIDNLTMNVIGVDGSKDVIRTQYILTVLFHFFFLPCIYILLFYDIEKNRNFDNGIYL